MRVRTRIMLCGSVIGGKLYSRDLLGGSRADLSRNDVETHGMQQTSSTLRGIGGFGMETFATFVPCLARNLFDAFFSLFFSLIAVICTTRISFLRCFPSPPLPPPPPSLLRKTGSRPYDFNVEFNFSHRERDSRPIAIHRSTRG